MKRLHIKAQIINTALLISAVCLCVVLFSAGPAVAKELREHAKQANLAQVYQSFWLTKEQRQQLKALLDMRHMPIRFKYQEIPQGRVWLLSEYGKEELIDFKVVVSQQRIQQLEVLRYREPYGGEIKFSMFRKQFVGVALNQAQSGPRLSKQVDGISGATISVKASRRIAKLALLLDAKLNEKS